MHSNEGNCATRDGGNRPTLGLNVRERDLGTKAAQVELRGLGGAVLFGQSLSNSTDKLKRQLFGVRKREVALGSSIRGRRLNHRSICGDRRIDSNVILEGSKVEKRSAELERWHVVADRSHCIRHLGLDHSLHLLEASPRGSWLGGEVLTVRFERHASDGWWR